MNVHVLWEQFKTETYVPTYKDVFIALKVNVVEHYNIIANWKRKVGDFLGWSFGWDPKNISTLE